MSEHVLKCTEAYYLGMNAKRCGDWDAVETRDVWLDGARAVLALLKGK